MSKKEFVETCPEEQRKDIEFLVDIEEFKELLSSLKYSEINEEEHAEIIRAFRIIRRVAKIPCLTTYAK